MLNQVERRKSGYKLLALLRIDSFGSFTCSLYITYTTDTREATSGFLTNAPLQLGG